MFVKPETADMVGCFDSFPQDRFVCGWAQDARGTMRSVRVVVLLDEQVVAEGVTDVSRSDGLPGYRIDTLGRITARDIVERRARVFGEDPAGRRFGLPRYGPLITQLMRECFPYEAE